MKHLFTKSTILLLVVSFLCTFFIFLLLCIPGSSTTFSDTNALEQISATANKPLLAGEKIQGSFRALYSHVGIVSLRFTNFGKINTDIVEFRIKEKNNSSWIYKHTYKVDQFQPNQFFTFGFPIQSDSANKEYLFEVESISGQKGNAIGWSSYQPPLRLTYALPRNNLLSHPSYVLELMHYRTAQKISEGSTRVLLVGIYIGIFLLLLGFVHGKKLKDATAKDIPMVSFLLLHIKRHPFFFIIGLGLFFRLILAVGPFSGDTNAFMYESMYPAHHIFNVYAHSNEHGYNYSPLIFFVFISLAFIQNILHIFSWPFLWRLFLSLFDVATVYVLIQLAKIKKINPVHVAAVFFLNPISIFISGYHGQFENVATFFLLFAALLHYKTLHKKNPKLFLKWIYVTVGMLVKHIIVYQVLVFWKNEVGSKRTVLILFFLSVVVFLASFIPYWHDAKNLIIQNVFLYGGIPGYGIAFFFTQLLSAIPFATLWAPQIYKFIFIILLITIPLFITRKDVVRNMLFMSLFFLTFTPGIGIQYFILPIALGALFPTKWFYLYSIVISLTIEAIEQPIPLLIFRTFPIEGHATWLITALWFCSELLFLFPILRKLYRNT